MHRDTREVTRPERGHPFPPLLLLIVICAACYVNSVPCGFISDDSWAVVNGPLNSASNPVAEAFSIKTPIRDYSDAPAVYRPISLLALWANWRLSHQPWTFHAVNLALHLACVVLLYFLTLRIWKRRDLAFATALLFGVWPSHGESVALISARNDLISGALVVGGLLALASKRPITYAALMAAAVFSKESAVLIPLIAFLHWLRTRRRGICWEHIAALGALFVMLVARHFAHWSERSAAIISSAPPTPHASFGQSALGSVVYLGNYLMMSLAPIPGNAPRMPQPSTSSVTLAAMALIAAAAAAVALRRRIPQVTLGLCWFGVTAALATPLVYSQLILAERYVYLPQMGVGLALAAVLLSLGRSGRVALILLVMFATCVTVGNNRIYRDDVTYWAYISDKSPDASTYNNLAMALVEAGRAPEATAPMEKAVRMEPGNPFGHLNLGGLYLSLDRRQDAARELAEARRLAPNNPAVSEALRSLESR